MIQNRDKEREKILELLKPVGKPKVTLIKFNAKDVYKGDITRFKNLWIKLKTKVETIDMPTQSLKGKKANIVIIDEAVRLSKKDFLSVGLVKGYNMVKGEMKKWKK